MDINERGWLNLTEISKYLPKNNTIVIDNQNNRLQYVSDTFYCLYRCIYQRIGKANNKLTHKYYPQHVSEHNTLCYNRRHRK